MLKESILTYRNGKALSFLAICVFAIFLLECRLFKGIEKCEKDEQPRTANSCVRMQSAVLRKEKGNDGWKAPAG